MASERASRKGRPNIEQTSKAFAMLAAHIDRNTKVAMGFSLLLAILQLLIVAAAWWLLR